MNVDWYKRGYSRLLYLIAFHASYMFTLFYFLISGRYWPIRNANWCPKGDTASQRREYKRCPNSRVSLKFARYAPDAARCGETFVYESPQLWSQRFSESNRYHKAFRVRLYRTLRVLNIWWSVAHAARVCATVRGNCGLRHFSGPCHCRASVSLELASLITMLFPV